MSQIILSPSSRPRTTRPLSWITAWSKALAGPRDTFAPLMHDTNASINRAFSWIAAASAVIMILFVALVQRDAINNMDLAQIYGFPALLCAVPGGAVVGLALFALYTGITHGLAKVLGGSGIYERLAYIYAAYTAPLLVVVVLLTITGYVLPLILGLYILVLNVFAVRAVYRMGWVQAVVCGGWLPGLLLAVGIVILVEGLVTIRF